MRFNLSSAALCASTRQIDRDHPCDHPRHHRGEQVGEVEVRAPEPVRYGEYEHGEEGVHEPRHAAFHRAARGMFEAYAHANEDGKRLYDVIAHGEGGAVQSRPSDDEREEQHEQQREYQRDEGGAEDVRRVLFDEFGVFHVTFYAEGREDMSRGEEGAEGRRHGRMKMPQYTSLS